MRELHKQNKSDAQRAVQGLLEHSKTEMKVNKMIGDALTQKESLIEELEKELNLEKARREAMNQRFEQQMKEF